VRRRFDQLGSQTHSSLQGAREAELFYRDLLAGGGAPAALGLHAESPAAAGPSREADLFYADLVGAATRSARRPPARAGFDWTEAAPTSPSEPVPAAVAPHILEFRGTTMIASDPLAFRSSLPDFAVDLLRKLDDLGIRDTPSGRRDAYVDAIAWNEPAAVRAGFRTCPEVDGMCIASSCGMVVRSLWRLLGVRHKLLNPPYVPGTVMGNLRELARQVGALRPVAKRADFDAADVRLGDVIFIDRGNSQHVFTVINRQGDVFTSIDGGQSATGDGGCCSIQRRTRTLPAGGLVFVEDVNRRPITGVVKLESLPFTATVIDLVRHTPP
jgi:hypothetical protein